jgi:fused signal recognition particle receptor
LDSTWFAAACAAVVLIVLLLVWTFARRRRTASVAVATPAPAEGGLRRGLSATRRRLLEQLEGAFGRGGVDATFGELEEALVSADVGVKTTTALLERVRQQVGRAKSSEDIRGILRRETAAMLSTPPAPEPNAVPWVVLVTGVNGVGKTTTIGKLAARHVAAGRRVLLVAGDTFRAAAGEQLAVWAERTGADLVQQATGADPSAVAFDGMKAALARHVDVVLVDTAGRLHTRSNLMDELRKVRRVIGREVPGAPHETLLVLDATTGQNAVAQARMFRDAVEVTGLVLTKLDGTARGGVVLAVQHELGVPVRFVGVGEGVDDLRPFVAEEFADALFASEEAPAVRVA